METTVCVVIILSGSRRSCYQFQCIFQTLNVTFSQIITQIFCARTNLGSKASSTTSFCFFCSGFENTKYLGARKQVGSQCLSFRLLDVSHIIKLSDRSHIRTQILVLFAIIPNVEPQLKFQHHISTLRRPTESSTCISGISKNQVSVILFQKKI